MGGSKTQTVGYRYALGAHLALCHGPVDVIREILVDDKPAWSATTGSAPAGGSPDAPARIGTVADMAATSAQTGDAGASITFPGTLAGVRRGQSYRLALSGGGSREVTLLSIAWDAETDETTWSVEPGDLTFPSQDVEVFEAASGAANGGAGGGRIRIDKPNLFGGKSREGGIRGDIDILMGGPGQGANDYLAARLGGEAPGYRGIVSLVLRRVYLGINPYLKPWAVRLTRVLTAEGGASQWYPEKAAIVTEARISDAAIHIALDVSGSMSGSRMAAQKGAVATLIEEIGRNADADRPNDIRIVLWADEVVGSIERRNMGAADYAEMEAWVSGLSTVTDGGTDFGLAFDSAAGFFSDAGEKRRIVLFVTDGEPEPASSLEDALEAIAAMPAADIFAIGIASADTSAIAAIDNTPIDGVPVVQSGSSTALVASMRAAFGTGPDMNPAHIIRECLTNAIWGLGFGETEIGASFEDAADTLYAEGFGLSLIWQQDSSIEDFVHDVLTHIDASLFIDRRTGLWELKLIRDDYDPNSLPLFDETNVVDWGRLGRRTAAELCNSVTVRYTEAQTEETAAVSVTDPAAVQQLGEVIAATRDFPGLRVQSLAVRVAERELHALSAPLLSGEIVVNREGSSLNPGDVIRLRSEARLGGTDVLARISEVGHGDGRANGIRIALAEDVFALGSTPIAGGREPPRTDLTSRPRPLARRLVEEAPYWLLVRELGHAQADAALAEDSTAGVLVAVAGRPAPDAESPQLWVDPGTGPEQDGVGSLAPSCLLAETLSDDPEARELLVSDWVDIDEVAIGSLAGIGGELVRVDGVSESRIWVGRGCLDTVPRAHAAGTPVIFFDAVAGIGTTDYTAGETVTARLLSVTGKGVLGWGSAPEDLVTFDQRAFRPLPVGRLQANGTYAPPAGALLKDGVTLTWAHRDRLSQTSPVIADYTATSIGPEPGVSYAVEIRWVDPETGDAIVPAATEIDAGTGTSRVLSLADVPVEDAPEGVTAIDVVVRARRIEGGTWAYAREDRALRFLIAGAGWGVAWGASWGS
ncbi:VWA domain-containing protein [Amaricoccus macauensis]|uniref:VWA domain-containing protein n=1 Tax=Amaricoccus macauensis TaxID=57001 RepID=UPI003C7E1BBE